MTAVFDRFLDLFRDLERHDVEYILIGGLAVVLHGFPRFTEDVDLLLRPTPDNVERLKRALTEGGWLTDSEAGEIVYTDLDEYAVIRVGTAQGFYIDIMARVGSVAEYESVEWEEIEVEGVKIRVATAPALLDLKKNSLRPRDQEDVLFLKRLLGKS